MKTEHYWYFEKQLPPLAYGNVPGRYLNSPPKWSYCGRYRGGTLQEAMVRAMFAVGSSLVRIMPQFEEEDKGYL